MDNQLRVPASKMLRLIIENSILKQQLLQRQIVDTQAATGRAIEEEAESIGPEVERFDMESLQFILKPEVTE